VLSPLPALSVSSIANQRICSVEQVNGIVSISHDVSLNTKSLQQFSLEFGSSIWDGNESFSSNSVNNGLELAWFNFGEWFWSQNFKIRHSLWVFNLKLLQALLLVKLSIHRDLTCSSSHFGHRDSVLADNFSSLSLSFSFSLGLTSIDNGVTVSLDFSQQLLGFFGFGFEVNLQLFELTNSLLFDQIWLILVLIFQGFGWDFDGLGNSLLKIGKGSLVLWLNRFDINVGDNKVIGGEDVLFADLTVFIDTKDTLSDDFSWVLVEIIKGNCGDGSSDSWTKLIAHITNEIFDLKQLD